MMLTDREWMRFMTFALIVGGVLGATNTGALLLLGQPFVHAVVLGIVFTTSVGLVVHAIAHTLLNRAQSPVDGDTDSNDEDADESPEAETA